MELGCFSEGCQRQLTPRFCHFTPFFIVLDNNCISLRDFIWNVGFGLVFTCEI